MPFGLRVPVGVNESGGANITRTEGENTLKILKLALAEGGDENGFQDLGITGSLIFSKRDFSFRANAEAEINRILNKFPELVELDPNNPIEIEFGKEGDVSLSFKYVDLITQDVNEFQQSFLR